MIGILAAALLLLAVYLYKYYENVRRYPKGPTPLPLIGNLHQFEPHRLHNYFEELQDKYGDVFTVWTPSPMVVLMSYSAIKEALVTKGDDFVGRLGRFPDDLFMTTPNGGVIFSEGESWREQRRTAIQILRDLGMGKNLMEEQVRSSMHELMDFLEKTEDKSAVDFRWPIQILVANVVNEVLFGYHYKWNDCERLMRFSTNLAELIETMRKNPLVFLTMQFPWMARFPIVGWLGQGQYQQMVARLHDHIREDIEQCRKTYSEHDEPQSFVHAYLQRMMKSEFLNEDQMVNVCSDFFIAGMETTSTTLRWAMLHMANNQRVQDKIRGEIHSVVGRDGSISMADKVRLPYATAAVHEMQRVANILPLNVNHRTVNDTKVFEHRIPRDTIIMAQVHNVLKRSDVFKHSDDFRPERFLLEDGKTPNKETIEYVIPFSMGKRLCAGEGLARMELFLALTMILQKYRILPPKEAPLDLSPVVGSVLVPKPNKLQIVPV